MKNANNTIARNLTPTAAQVEKATTIRKLADRLNALVAQMDSEAAALSERGVDWLDTGSKADLPLVTEIVQEKTPTGRLRENAYVPVRGIGDGAFGISRDQTVTILRTVRA